MKSAARRRATPMPIWTPRRGSLDTTPAPSQPPAMVETMMESSVTDSTGTTAMKMRAWATTGSECPTIMVPGICSSGTRRSILNAVVVGANDPMPRVSKKFVTKPITSRRGDGALIRDHATRAHHIA